MGLRKLVLPFVALAITACGAVDPAAVDTVQTVGGETVGKTVEPLVAPPGLTPLGFPLDQLPVEIVNVNSGKCLDVFRSETADGTAVQQWTCHQGKNQTWFLISRGDGTYQIRPGHVGNMNLNVPGDSMDDGTHLNILNQSTDGQVFAVRLHADDGSYEIASVKSGKCVDVPWWSTDDGKYIQQVTCNSSTAQRWYIKARAKPFNLIAKHSDKCVDVYGASTADGANVQQYSCARAENQRWYLRDAGVTNGTQYWSIVSNGSGKCLDVYKAGKDNGVNVQQWTCHGGDNQKWSVTQESDGYVTIKNKNSGRCLDVYGVGQQDGANIQQWGCTGRGNQRWFWSNYAERHVQVVQIADDAGNGAPDVSNVGAHVAMANALYGRYGIRLVYDPATDLTTINSSTLYELTDDTPRTPTAFWLPYPCPTPTGGVEIEDHGRIGCAQKVAERWPDKVVVFTRPGGGFSCGNCNLITIGFMAPVTERMCAIVPNISWLAHEFGHYVGLMHPFVITDDQTKASAYLKANGDDKTAFDGDRLLDTPPTPFWQTDEEKCIGPTQPTAVVTLDGTTGPVDFTVNTDNVMTYYYNVAPTVTPQQAAITRATSWQRGW